MIGIRYWSLSNSLDGTDIYQTFVNGKNFTLTDKFIQNGRVLDDKNGQGNNSLTLLRSYRDENRTEYAFIRDLYTKDSKDVDIVETMYYLIHFASSNETWNETIPLDYLSLGEQVLFLH